MEGKDNGQKEEPDGTGEPPAPAPPTRETHDPSAASAERPAKVGSAGNPIHIRDPDVGRWTVGLMIWTGGLVGVAIVSAGISYFQWCELQKAGVQTDSTIAALNRQAGATEAQQKLMQQQLDEMRDEQRPWVYSDAPVFLRSITKAYPSASGAAKCCRCGIGFMIEQITNMMTLGDADDRLPPLLDRVPAALPG